MKPKMGRSVLRAVAFIALSAFLFSCIGCAGTKEKAGESVSSETTTATRSEQTEQTEETTGEQVTETEESFVDLQGRTIRIFMWNFQEDQLMETPSGRRFLNRIGEIEEKFNCTVEIPQDNDYTAAWAAIISGQPTYDIMSITAPHLIAQPVTTNCYMNLNTLGVFNWEEEKWDDRVNKILNFDGKQYGCSTDIGIMTCQVLYFNKRLVTEAGYDPNDIYKWQDEGTWTWDKFDQVAASIAKLSTSDNEVWGSIGNDGLLYTMLCVSNGSNWIRKEDTGVHFNAGDPACMEALQYFVQLYERKIIPDTDDFSDAKEFLNGKVGFLVDYVERMQYKQTYGKMTDDFGVVMFPKGPRANDYFSFIDWYGGWAIPTGIENPEDIARVVDYLCEPSLSKEEAEREAEALRLSWVRDRESMKVFKLLETNSVISPTLLSSPVFSDWKGRVSKIRRGQITAAAAIAEVESNYETTLKDVWTFK